MEFCWSCGGGSSGGVSLLLVGFDARACSRFRGVRRAEGATRKRAPDSATVALIRRAGASRRKVRTSKPQGLFSGDEVMSIPAPWIVAERPPSIRRTSRSLWRSRFHSRFSAGASASSSVRCSVKLGSRTRDDLGTLQKRSALPGRLHIGGALRPMHVHVPAGRDRRLQTRARSDPRRRHLRQVHAPPNPLTRSRIDRSFAAAHGQCGSQAACWSAHWQCSRDPCSSCFRRAASPPPR
jgi:hypothetical protein